MRFRWDGQEFPYPEKATFAEVAACERKLGQDLSDWTSIERTLAYLWVGAKRHAMATGRPVPTWEQVAESSPEDDGFDVLDDPEGEAPADDAGPPEQLASPSGSAEADASSTIDEPSTSSS